MSAFKKGAAPKPPGIRPFARYKRPSKEDIKYAAGVVRRLSFHLDIHDWFDQVREMGWFIGADVGKYKRAWMAEVTRNGGWRYGSKPVCGCDPKTGDGGDHFIPMFCHKLVVFAPGVLKCRRCESMWRIPEGLEWERHEPDDDPFWMTGCSGSPDEHALDCAHCNEWDKED